MTDNTMAKRTKGQTTIKSTSDYFICQKQITMSGNKHKNKKTTDTSYDLQIMWETFLINSLKWQQCTFYIHFHLFLLFPISFSDFVTTCSDNVLF